MNASPLSVSSDIENYNIQIGYTAWWICYDTDKISE